MILHKYLPNLLTGSDITYIQVYIYIDGPYMTRILPCVSFIHFKGHSTEGAKRFSVLIYRVSEKSGTSGNLNYFSYFYLQIKVNG
jgi:hypothetical protein